MGGTVRAAICIALACAAGSPAAHGARAEHLVAHLADPTRPAAVGSAARQRAPRGGEPVRVQAILGRERARYAIVNDVLVKPGDRVGSVTIEAIHADGVLYSRGGRTAFARIAGERIAVRRPAPRRVLAAEVER